MKTNQAIIEKLESKFFRESIRSASNPIAEKHFYGRLSEFKEDLLKALEAKDAEHKREMMKLTWPLRYKIGETT